MINRKFSTTCKSQKDDKMSNIASTSASNRTEFIVDETGVKLSRKMKRLHEVLAEYALIAASPPRGVFVMPTYEDPFIWHGLIFVDNGFYDGAMFRFHIQLPADWPDELPIIIFDQHVFHPSVDARTNRLHLPESASNDHERWALHKIVNSLSEIFRMRHFDKLPHVNDEAVKSYRLADKQTFRDRVDRCVRISRQNIYEQPTTNDDPFAFVFSKFDEMLHRPLLNEIVGTNDEAGTRTDDASTLQSGENSPAEERERNSWVNSSEFTMLRAD